jgi:hypothetical protein
MVVWFDIGVVVVGNGFINAGGGLDGFRNVRVWSMAINPVGVGDGERDVLGASGVGDDGPPNISKIEGCPSSRGESTVLDSTEVSSSTVGANIPADSC